MIDITQLDRRALPSNRQLVKATVLALLAAGAILVGFVLPAEYGIDPTGIGGRLGLSALSSGAVPKESSPGLALDPSLTLSSTAPGASLVWRSELPLRNDEESVTLQPRAGVEIKADMKEGDRFVFSWTAVGGTVNFDMHGEKHNASKDEFTSYWKGSNASAGHGEFQAPFTGRHGWYWENRGDKSVTVKVRTSGFYERLYKL